MTTISNLRRCQEGLSEKERTIEDMYSEQSKTYKTIYELRERCYKLTAELAAKTKQLEDLETESKGLRSDLSVCYGHGPALDADFR